MPLYEYQCDACAHSFEQIQRFSDPPPTSCPRCGGAVRKLLSSPAIQFKGTGWYVTDYAKQGRKEPADAAEAKAGGPADGATSKPDRKDGGKSGDSTGSSDSSSAASKAARPASARASS